MIANWRNLPHGSVEEKKKNDFVTFADRESEERGLAEKEAKDLLPLTADRAQ